MYKEPIDLIYSDYFADEVGSITLDRKAEYLSVLPLDEELRQRSID